MSTPTRMRARLNGDVAEIRILMTHPMDTGTRKNSAGEIVPAHYITDVDITLGGRPVLAAKWSVAVSQDPFLALRTGGAKAGDKLVVSWKDNTGDSRSDEITLA